MKQNLFLPEIEGRTYFVGDIHGQYSELMQQLVEMEFDQTSDRLICVGDLIDRGSETVECLNLLYQNWFYSALGNHEDMFLESVGSISMKHIHLGNGGEWINDHSDAVLGLFRSVIEEKMPLTITVQFGMNEIGVVHAAAMETWAETMTVQQHKDIEKVLWSRKPFNAVVAGKKAQPIEGIDAIVSGHNRTEKPLFSGNQVWIDTFEKTGRFSILSAQEILENVERPFDLRFFETPFTVIRAADINTRIEKEFEQEIAGIFDRLQLTELKLESRLLTDSIAGALHSGLSVADVEKFIADSDKWLELGMISNEHLNELVRLEYLSLNSITLDSVTDRAYSVGIKLV